MELCLDHPPFAFLVARLCIFAVVWVFVFFLDAGGDLAPPLGVWVDGFLGVVGHCLCGQPRQAMTGLRQP